MPTFHDLDNKKKDEAKGGIMSSAQGTMGYIGSSIGSVASGMGSSGSNPAQKSGEGTGALNSITKSLQTSKGLASVSDSIKRNTGLDIHKALGGKTAVDLAEERLQRERESLGMGSQGYGGNYGGYQGISIPLTPALSTEGAPSTSTAAAGGGESLNKVSTSKYGHQWGADAASEPPKKEEKQVLATQKLF